MATMGERRTSRARWTALGLSILGWFGGHARGERILIEPIMSVDRLVTFLEPTGIQVNGLGDAVTVYASAPFTTQVHYERADETSIIRDAPWWDGVYSRVSTWGAAVHSTNGTRSQLEAQSRDGQLTTIVSTRPGERLVSFDINDHGTLVSALVPEHDLLSSQFQVYRQNQLQSVSFDQPNASIIPAVFLDNQDRITIGANVDGKSDLYRYTAGSWTNLTSQLLGPNAQPSRAFEPIRGATSGNILLRTYESTGDYYQIYRSATQDLLTLRKISDADSLREMDALGNVLLSTANSGAGNTPTLEYYSINGERVDLGTLLPEGYQLNRHPRAALAADGDVLFEGQSADGYSYFIWKAGTAGLQRVVDNMALPVTHLGFAPDDSFYFWTRAVGGTTGSVAEFYRGRVLPDPTSTKVVWTEATMGNWHTPQNWLPARVPDELRNPGEKFDVLISPPGPATVDLTRSATVTQLTLLGESTRLRHSQGTLTVTQGLQLNGGTYEMMGGALANTVVQGDGLLLVRGFGSRLENVTLADTRVENASYVDLSGMNSVAVGKKLVLQGRPSDSGLAMRAVGPTRLDGPGKLQIGDRESQSAAVVRLSSAGDEFVVGERLEVDVHNGAFEASVADTKVINRGTIRLTQPDSWLVLDTQAFVNDGLIIASQGTQLEITTQATSSGVSLGTGQIRLEQPRQVAISGTYNQSLIRQLQGGSDTIVQLGGTILNESQTVDFSGFRPRFMNTRIIGGIVANGERPLILEGALHLEGVQLATDLHVPNVSFSVYKGLRGTGTIAFDTQRNAGSQTFLILEDAQTWEGDLTVKLTGDLANGIIVRNEATFARDVQLKFEQGSPRSLSIVSDQDFTTAGTTTIESGAFVELRSNGGDWIQAGELKLAGGLMLVQPNWVNTGQVVFGDGGRLLFPGEMAGQDWGEMSTTTDKYIFGPINRVDLTTTPIDWKSLPIAMTITGNGGLFRGTLDNPGDKLRVTGNAVLERLVIRGTVNLGAPRETVELAGPMILQDARVNVMPGATVTARTAAAMRGTGEVVFVGDSGAFGSSQMTIDEGVTVRTAGGGIGDGAVMVSFVQNSGQIVLGGVGQGGEFVLEVPQQPVRPVNPGKIQVLSGNLTLKGSWKTTEIAALELSNSRVRLTGQLNNQDQTWDSGSSIPFWTLAGNVQGGVVISADNRPLALGTGSLNNVTLRGPFSLEPQADVTVSGSSSGGDAQFRIRPGSSLNYNQSLPTTGPASNITFVMEGTESTPSILNLPPVALEGFRVHVQGRAFMGGPGLVSPLTSFGQIQLLPGAILGLSRTFTNRGQLSVAPQAAVEFAAAETLNQGQINLAGSLIVKQPRTSFLRNAEQGQIRGHGKIIFAGTTGILQNQGKLIIDALAGTQPSLVIEGNFTQTASGKLEWNLTQVPDPQSPILDIVGDAQWNGQTSVMIAPGLNLPAGSDVYLLRQKSGDLSGLLGERVYLPSGFFAVERSKSSLRLVDFVPRATVGNFDGDYDVDSHDMLVLLEEFTGALEAGQGTVTADQGDLDGDRDVDTADLLRFLESWTGAHPVGPPSLFGTTLLTQTSASDLFAEHVVTVPEPTSWGMLIAFAGAAARLSKRRGASCS